jgi:hypothetical protein
MARRPVTTSVLQSSTVTAKSKRPAAGATEPLRLGKGLVFLLVPVVLIPATVMSHALAHRLQMVDPEFQIEPSEPSSVACLEKSERARESLLTASPDEAAIGS